MWVTSYATHTNFYVTCYIDINMRKPCLECCFKHLGTAASYIDEIHLGYPQFKIRAVGELNHASTEVLGISRKLAMVIREHRVKWYRDPNYSIPFEALGEYISICEQLPDNLDLPDLPDECLEGLDTSEEGEVHFSSDNRP